MPIVKYKTKTVKVPVEKIVEKIVEVPVEVQIIKEVEKIVDRPVPTTIEVIKEVEKIVEVPVEVVKTVEVIREVEKENPVNNELALEVEKLLSDLEKKNKEIRKLQNLNNQFSPQPDNVNPFKERGTSSFGTTWPSNPAKGDLFLKVDIKPNKLFKWNGRKWIEIDRLRVIDTLAYNIEYIDWLIDQVRRGLKDYEDLSDIEKSQITDRIKQIKNDG